MNSLHAKQPRPRPTLPLGEIDRGKTTAEHYPLIEHLARRFARRRSCYLGLDDVISAGMVGLMESISRYDPQRASTFNAFAELRIKGAILDSLRASDYLSRDQRACLDELRRVRRRLAQKLGREPEPAELACAL